MRRACLLALLLSAAVASADGPSDNIPDKVRPVPPKGTPIPDADRAEIAKGLAELQQLIKEMGKEVGTKRDLLPDVQIFEKAVRWALDHDEVYDPKPGKDGKQPPVAGAVRKALAGGLERAKALKDGKTWTWTTQTGPVLRGYRSKIDGSAQPYWVIVPAEYDVKGSTRHRLDFWWHGRFETQVEAVFMANSPGAGSGIIPAPGAFIVHPYGRFSNANKLAGEIDTLEVLENVRKHYRIDMDRLVARGFSMGGAACWQYGAHYPTLWAACAPGAGFAETPEFLKEFQKEDTSGAPWYEKKLWHMYNASDTAENFFNLPTVAYSGENDSQKQAADVMAREFKKVGLELKHVIGPKTGHGYEKDAKIEVNKLIDAFVAKGKPAVPKEIKFTTYTTRYDKCGWVSIWQLEKHWDRARIEATLGETEIVVKTENVAVFSLPIANFVGREDRRDLRKVQTITIDGQQLKLGITGASMVLGSYWKRDGKWFVGTSTAVYKHPRLQGPIDDAFMDAFLMVKPTGKPLNEAVGKWVEREMKHAAEEWRKQFRGDTPMKADSDVTDADIRNNNLVLWGDPESNKVLARIADKLPVKWTEKGLVVGDKTYDAGTHVPLLIYPNPLNPTRYVVLNSGFTYREYDYLNNARQVPKLPDYAVIDVTTPPNSRYPGKIVRAGFFNEWWKLQADDGRGEK